MAPAGEHLGFGGSDDGLHRLGWSRLLQGRTRLGSAYKGAWVGLLLGLILVIVEPWSYVVSGAAGVGCVVAATLAGAGWHRTRSAAARRD
jgi:hypothetical protein